QTPGSRSYIEKPQLIRAGLHIRGKERCLAAIDGHAHRALKVLLDWSRRSAAKWRDKQVANGRIFQRRIHKLNRCAVIGKSKIAEPPLDSIDQLCNASALEIATPERHSRELAS